MRTCESCLLCALAAACGTTDVSLAVETLDPSEAVPRDLAAATLPVGWLDSSNPNATGTLSGWAADRGHPSAAIWVHLYADGPAGVGSLIAWTLTDLPRPDVNAALGISGAHGFRFAIPPSYRDGRTHSFYVYAIDKTGVLPAALGGAPKNYNSAGFPHQVWFSPDLASADMQALFTQPQLWSVARGRTQVFKLWGGNLLPAGACPICGPNSLDSLAAAGAFTQLKAWGLPLATELGPIKPVGVRQGGVAGSWCNPDITAGHIALPALRSLAARGISVRYLTMDEPYHGGRYSDPVTGETCAFTLAQSAAETARYVKMIHREFPDTLIIDIEPFPANRMPMLQAFVDALQNQGVALSGFHLDFDYNLAARLGLDSVAELRGMKAFLDARNIPMGVTFIGVNGVSEQIYFQHTMSFVETVRKAVGVPQHAVFQSWVYGVSGAFDLPHNVPETDAYSHTRLLNAGLERLNRNAEGCFDGLERGALPNFTLSGWARDPDTLDAPVSSVHFYADAPAGEAGSVFLGYTGATSAYRPDVGSHGFSFVMPAGTGGAHRLYGYAFDTTTGSPLPLCNNGTVRTW